METIIVAEKRLAYKTVKRRKVEVETDGPVDEPIKAMYLFDDLLRDEPHESLYCLALDSAGNWLGCYRAADGTINRASVYTRKLLSFLLLDTNAASIILCHNHPGGQTEFSREDVHLTQSLQESLKPLDIQILDHLVCVTPNRPTDLKWTSMRQEGLL